MCPPLKGWHHPRKQAQIEAAAFAAKLQRKAGKGGEASGCKAVASDSAKGARGGGAGYKPSQGACAGASRSPSMLEATTPGTLRASLLCAVGEEHMSPPGLAPQPSQSVFSMPSSPASRLAGGARRGGIGGGRGSRQREEDYYDVCHTDIVACMAISDTGRIFTGG